MSESPLDFEPPAGTDDLLAAINSLRAEVTELRDRQDKLVEAVNSIGKNMQWLVANTQGIFQMFSDPNIINQVMGQMMGGLTNGGQAAGN